VENKDLFIENLNKCGEVKYEVSQVHNRVLSKLKNVYAIVFQADKKNFNSFRNMKFYQAGVQSPEARPKLHEFLDSFINLLNHYELIGDTSMTDYLKEHGVKTELLFPELKDGPVEIEKDKKKDFNNNWSFSMGEQKIPETKKELLREILIRSTEVQKESCTKQEQIEEGAKLVEDGCKIKKSLFMKALNIKCKEIQQKSVDNELVKVEEDMEQTQDIVDYFKDGLNLPQDKKE
jgi:hypothetical protein